MRSRSSVAILMIVLGGVGVSGIGGHHPIGWVPYALAGLLIAGGVSLFLGRAFAYFAALAIAVLTAASGIGPLVGHPELALPIPAGLSIGVGLYLCLRLAATRAIPGRGFLAASARRDNP